uniref:GTP diphosphokinase n=1 Tax=Chenopodium quinoa TaxID=63459 RepID=A0A803L218_CHEQI
MCSTKGRQFKIEIKTQMITCHPSDLPTTTNFSMLGQRTSTTTLKLFHNFRWNSRHFRPFYPHKVGGSKFVINSSLGPLFASAAAVGSSTHAAVTSTITQVAVTAVAIASGACLSTKVDFLWPKSHDQPSPLILEGVDVTGYPIFNNPKVQKAVSFARKAHHGQLRKNGEPYLAHCLHTGRALADLVPSSGQRAADTVVAGILHDVIDDTSETLVSIRENFGNDVAQLVAGVSRLSYINQANNLRVMLLGMVDDPRVVLIKLADRLHNMRTIYALPLSKAQAVAEETLVVWCSLASRLGLWALKAELEDLCFAVLQPQMFCQMRAELASMWSPCRRARNPRRVSTKSSLLSASDTTASNSFNCAVATEDDDTEMKDLLEAVLPFELLLDRGKRMNFLSNFTSYSKISTKPKVVRDAGVALASLAMCEEALEHELLISTSYVPGMEVTLSSRLKSLYSIYSKMKRKDIDINEVYDARALRVIIGDKDGTLHGPAVSCCYSVLDIVHKLWSPIDGEFDDYIVNPKPSGYQSLHTAVQGPDNSALEVQIRTQRMHEYAEHGLAAHWLYKETNNKSLSGISLGDSHGQELSNFSQGLEEQSSVGDIYWKYSSLKAGHPALRVERSNLLAAVIISVDKDGRELLVAVSFGLAASEAVADRRTSFQIKRWEASWMRDGLNQDMEIGVHVLKNIYFAEMDYIIRYQDQYDRLLPTFTQVIDLTEEEESNYWTVMSAVFDGKDVDSVTSCLGSCKTPMSGAFSSSSEANINNKVHLLRTMLQWEEQIFSEVGLKQGTKLSESYDDSLIIGEVAVVSWPDGDIVRLRAGSTAADAARRIGLEGKFVLVNGQPVQPNIELRDGDVVEVRL